MFLTAKQAREITEQSDATRDKIISDILDEVRRIAETGKSEILHSCSHANHLANDFFKVENCRFSHQNLQKINLL
jgi:23S rRNA U2552 (ribose-2'-O)-methylase RlmE/FtsJ